MPQPPTGPKRHGPRGNTSRTSSPCSPATAFLPPGPPRPERSHSLTWATLLLRPIHPPFGWYPMDPSHSHQHSRSGQPARVLHFLSGTPSRPSSPARSSRSPARPAPVDYSMDEKRSEKAPFDASQCAVGQQPRCSPCQCAFPDSALPLRSASLHPGMPSARPTLPSTLLATSSPLAASSWTATLPSYTRPRGLRIANLFKPWIPIILYALTSLGFLAAISFWKVEVFAGAHGAINFRVLIGIDAPSLCRTRRPVTLAAVRSILRLRRNISPRLRDYIP